MADKLLKTDAKMTFGADPEIFLLSNGQIVGSERAIPEGGVATHEFYSHSTGVAKLVRDGVQVELHLPPTNCREWLSLEIMTTFQRLKGHLANMAANDKLFEVSFTQVVEVSPEELKSLTPLSRRLGCQPSFNWYSPAATIGVNPDTYTKRSAGGHLHFGLPSHLMPYREKLAPISDVLIGNTSVLIDRDPNAAERRRVYGRAGEFRTPRHGFEYRTLSNYWLRSKELVGLVTGLMRLAVFVLDTSVDEKDGWPADEALMELVNLRDVEKAINENNLELAKANFEAVKVFLHRHLPKSPTKTYQEVSLDGEKLASFDTFVRGIDEGGIERWFPEAPFTHWQHCVWLEGWEKFLKRVAAGGR